MILLMVLTIAVANSLRVRNKRGSIHANAYLVKTTINIDDDIDDDDNDDDDDDNVKMNSTVQYIIALTRYIYLMLKPTWDKGDHNKIKRTQ